MDERAEFNRLYWHSRRGMLEIDVMLMPFTQHHFKTLSDADQVAYRQLLDCEDQDIWEWLRGFKPPEDPNLARIVIEIRSRVGDLAFQQTP
ncbi:MAG: succinate dehydrogenase assembly factor 2 [Litorivicinaceae bacterium]|jgi:antitoxin CptB|nr:succinate dehydrogenase assembly factor 2 [Litorivicinaceae bacterium]MDP5329343.1 succinate dehydrogenase assembly factor 2 [Litorivicinaceae bacterium]MDP5330931.1 succinate dehydrogenase assembly factor 2 [Litorivicinaceae bacterium]MDP5340571.1 succinate dehydrogenase assembly factor 2 [Litorivicinaceae bacterium]MDP5342173.1 succinate dehydrogenase assembly factor 2 [Litorivicinaceae bacterium]